MVVVKKEQPDTNKKVFAKGFCFAKYFWIFVIAMIIGCVWEELLEFIYILIEEKTFAWSFQRGLFWGPFSPVYGFGAVILTFIFARKKLAWWKYIVYGALIGGGFEYLASYIQELLTGSVSWDYSNYFLNINGRTCLPYMLFWGIIAMLWALYLFPRLSNFIESFPYNFSKYITIIAIIFFIIDFSVTWSAAFRQTNRRNNIPPRNAIESFYDSHYNDEYFDKWFGKTEIKE